MRVIAGIFLTVIMIMVITLARIGLLYLGSSPDTIDAVLGAFLILWFVFILMNVRR